MKQLLRQLPAISLIALISFGVNSCFLHYYRANSVERISADTIRQLLSGNKYFVLHTNRQAYSFTHVKVNNDNIEGDLDILSAEHTRYLKPRPDEKNRFPVKDKSIVLYEVHLYTQDSMAYGHFAMPVKNVYRLDVYGLDREATNASKVVSIVGIAAATALITVIVAAVSSSHPDAAPVQTEGRSVCSPKVYMYTEKEKELAGILCSGAIFAPLERTDYVPLPGVPNSDHLHLQIRTGENEELFVHSAKLLQVSHGVTDNVLVDRKGKVLIYRQPAGPEKVYTGEGHDVKADIAVSDGKFYSFTNHPAGQISSNLELDFKKPAGVRSGKLVIRARNSPWGAYIFKDFKSLYGDYYPALVRQKDRVDRAKLLQCELDQSLPLSVSIKDGNGWKFVDYFITPGNGALRDMIMEIDLTGFETASHLQLKLETTYMFWDLDYAGMDFSDGLAFQTTYLPASSILESDSPNHPRVIERDNNNMDITDKGQLDFDFALAPAPSPGFANSYFLAGAAYYHDNTHYEGKPQLDKLAAFSSKGAFDAFSRQKFEALMSAVKTGSSKDVVVKN